MSKKTPLFDTHKKYGAKLIDFGGWMMPVSYSTPLKEHEWVRTKCGVFDVSHMGEIEVTGNEATAFLHYLTVGNVRKLSVGQGQYSAILNDQGGFIDDLIYYKVDEDHYLVCVNASNADKDFAWFTQQSEKFDVAVENASHKYAQLAVQGPLAKEAIAKILDRPTMATVAKLDYMEICKIPQFGPGAYIARTGYTGEFGYELYIPANQGPALFEQLLADENRVKPIGLGARDTLRLEACYLLYGNDMNDEVSPLEAGVQWAVDLQKDDFIGKSALSAQLAQGLKRKIFAFTMEESGIPRHGMSVERDGVSLGIVTSGSVLPTVSGAGGMALLDPTKVKIGDTIEIDIRGKRKLARIARRPLYSARVRDQ